MSELPKTKSEAFDLKILKVISLLMDYPEQILIDAYDDIRQVIASSVLISPEMRTRLHALLDDIIKQGLMNSQSLYDSQFDRGRSLSLLLFEHVHGESRDRGQAMVDLIQNYTEHGFDVSVKELPDFIPLYLEFLSTQDITSARVGLADVAHILALLSARLRERNSLYSVCFDALLQISGQDIEKALNEAKEKIADEIPDNSLLALDKEWEDEVVDFLDANQQDRCPSQTSTLNQAAAKANRPLEQAAVPVHWVDFNQPNNAKLQPAGKPSQDHKDAFISTVANSSTLLKQQPPKQQQTKQTQGASS